MRLITSLFILFFALISPALADPFAIPDTQVFSLHGRATDIDYEIRVAAPPGYATSGKTYPTIYMLDADYSFALVRNVVQHFLERENLPPLILVAIAYPGGAADYELYRTSRTRDYTPTFVPDGGYGPKYQRYSGGAPKFADFLEDELVPFIAERFPVDTADRTIVGHSYGGLFGLYLFVNRPELFQRYVVVSPSIWYDDKLVLHQAREPAQPRQRPAHLFMAVGAIEQPYMSSDLLDFAKALTDRKDESLKVDTQIYPDETHNSVFPGAVTRGLLKVFDAFPALAPPRGPAPAPTPAAQ